MTTLPISFSLRSPYVLILWLLALAAYPVEGSWSYNLPHPGDNNGSLFAILTNGDVTDFGWSYTVNSGRVNMERGLNVAGTQWIPNVLDNTSAIAVMRQLVSIGVRMIISASNSHGTAATQMAQQFSNVSFVQFAGKSTLPNLSILSFTGSDLFFALGAFCAATATNGRVGFIAPTATGTLNAFFTGVRFVNPNATVYAWFVDAYDDPDRTAGATDILLGEPYSVTSVSGHQDDYTIAQKVMAKGILATGVTGYALKNLYGQQVGVSVLRNWTTVMELYAAPLFGNGSTVFRQDFTGSFANGAQYFDTPSYLVTADQWAQVSAAVDLLKAGKQPYYCNPDIAAAGWPVNLTTGCLTNATLFSTVTFPQINSLGHYRVPLVLIPFSTDVTIALTTLGSMGVALVIACAVLVFVTRNHKKMKAGNIYSINLMLIGCALVYASVITWGLAPSDAVCSLRVWLASIGSGIAVGFLITKNYRLYLLFTNTRLDRTIAARFSDMRMTVVVTAVVIMLCTLLAAREGVGADDLDTIQGVQGLSQYEIRHVCSSTVAGSGILYVLLAFHLLMFVAGIYLSFLLRHVDRKEYSEAGPVAYTTYIDTLTLVVGGSLGLATDLDQLQLGVLVGISLLFGATATVLIVIGSRIITAFGVDITDIGGRIRRSVTASSASTTRSVSSGDLSLERRANTVELA